MKGMTNLLDLRDKFVSILDIEKGDGACALSLLDEVINAEQLKGWKVPEPIPFHTPTATADSNKEIPEVYSIAEAIEFFAEQFFSEMSFDEIHTLAVELLEQRIHQLTQRLNETNRADN